MRSVDDSCDYHRGRAPPDATSRSMLIFFQAWNLKVFAFLGLASSCAWLPTWAVVHPTLLWPLRLGGVAFMAFQAVLLASFAETLNDSLVARDATESTPMGEQLTHSHDIIGRWKKILLLLGSGLAVADAAGFAWLCSSSMLSPSWLLVCISLASFGPGIVQLADPWGLGRGNLLSSAVAAASVLTVAWAALEDSRIGSLPIDDRLLGRNGSASFSVVASVALVIVGAVVAVLPPESGAIRSSWRGMYGSIEAQSGEKEGINYSASLAQGHTGLSDAGAPSVGIMLALASAAWANILVGWGSSGALENDRNGNVTSSIPLCVALIASAGGGGLYLWTLIAPAVLPGRDFS